jgi:hypothetical protein
MSKEVFSSWQQDIFEFNHGSYLYLITDPVLLLQEYFEAPKDQAERIWNALDGGKAESVHSKLVNKVFLQMNSNINLYSRTDVIAAVDLETLFQSAIKE